ncbi:MAG: bifunctional 4-hydroxy-2-oxoglutarate aldolase/2-dehydro-3-deoxy-phosphogluconate aldolase [Planctomycetota bacterium]
MSEHGHIERFGVVPVVVLEHSDTALKLAEALLQGGLPLLEITLRTETAPLAIAAVRKAFPEIWCGAGTVIRQPGNDGLQKALDAGAQFIVSPGFDPGIVADALDAGVAPYPACSTGTDIMAALSFGVKTLKFFPAEALGGVKVLKALHGAFAHTGVKFMPTGGVSEKNLADYLSLDAVLACGGTWMASAEAIQAGAWSTITEQAKRAVALAAEIRAKKST